MNKVEEMKEMLTDTVTKIYSTIKESSIVPRVRTVRPTRHTIKWKAKNH